MSQLGVLIKTAVDAVYVNSEAELAILYRKAEDNVSMYTASLINNPGMTPALQGPNVRQKRAQEDARVISTYLKSKKTLESEAIALALMTFLNANSKAVMIPASMANSGGPVVSTGFVTIIGYPE